MHSKTMKLRWEFAVGWLVFLVLLSGLVSAAGTDRNVARRGSFSNCRVQFGKGKTGHVAFLGGSITEMNGYRPMVCDILKERFPNTRFKFTNAGIASTCSTTGAFRLERDVLEKGPLDLLFVEFAVNDDQDAAHSRDECIRGMEGIIRHAREHNPCVDIIMTFFVNPGMLETIRKGKTPLPVASHGEVAQRYGVSTIDLAGEVAQRIEEGKLTWKKFGGTHPAPFGNRICASMIDDLFDDCWKEPAAEDAEQTPQTMPEPLDANNYSRGRLIDPAKAQTGKGWKLGVPPWKKLKGGCRRRFLNCVMLSASSPGAELTLQFKGKAIGAYVLAGPDAGIIEASVDEGPFRPADLYHRFSRGLHYPRTVLFAADLQPGGHRLELRLTGRKNARSIGTAARLLNFTAN